MRRAFTLIEVLIGILILAIALLGLGAVVPVVVRAQRNAADATAGIGALATAESYLRGSADLNRLTRGLPGLPGNTNYAKVGWGLWLVDRNPPLQSGDWSFDYLWEPLETTGSPVELDVGTGDILLQDDARYPTRIRLADRLYPARNSASTGPQFVWDFIGRRVATADGQPMQLQLAVFLRRLDAGIRVPEQTTPGAYQWTVYDVVTGTVPVGPPTAPLPAGAQRNAVAVDTNPAGGYPTGNGIGDYSGVRVMDVTFTKLPSPNDLRRDVLKMEVPRTDPLRTLARQPGQKLVDNLGNVYTVLGVYDGNVDYLLVDPPVPMGVPDESMNPPVERQLRQVALTPQVPVGVRVVTLTPQNSK
jgi:prepilin-type N-terminal cleavage/methylation domain-containing protein